MVLTLAGQAGAKELLVIYSAETHAMLHPCVCPDDPGGGLAERSAFLNGVVSDRNDLLLLDGGGFSGGGIYDTYSAGRAADSVRTAKTIAAMGLMKYDAVAVGDEELQYGGEWLVNQAKEAKLPLVCANCYTADGKYLVNPYVLVKKGNNTFAVTSVVTSDRLFPTDSSVIIKNPLESLDLLRREMRRKSQYQVLLSHLGEDETATLLRRAPGFLLAGNAHRKASVQSSTTMSKTPVLNFDFQGNSLSYALFNWRNRTLQLSNSGWFNIDGKTGVDEKITAVIGPPVPGSGRAAQESTDSNVQPVDEENMVYDLYIMSMCPYGLTALSELAELIRAFPRREWNVWFIGSDDGGKLISLSGEQEVFDEKLWLAVKELYPFRYHEFLFMRSESKAPTEVLLEEMDFDLRKLRKWAEEKGSEHLRRHYVRSSSLNVNESPTLYVNNKIYDKPITGGRLVRDKCRTATLIPPFCNDYPECFEDDDCQMKGKLGQCKIVRGERGERAVCEYRDDASFTITVLIADSTMDSPERGVIEATGELLPGAKINVLRVSSDAGKQFLARHNPSALPFFHFEKGVDTAYRFSAIQETLEPAADGGYQFRKGVVKENYFPQREEKPGQIVLYVDPLIPVVNRVIGALLASPELAKRVTLRPVLQKDPRDSNPVAQDRVRAEEALRWLILADEYPKSYSKYLELYVDSPASSYWFNRLKPIKVNKKKFLRSIDAGQARLGDYWDDFAEMSAGEPVMIILNNRVKVSVPNERALERALKSIRY
ncbi:MAG: hypothetical protein FWC23_10165 [Chitinispirillia bacterium]|nr:hypothetical protein [Chitinispirillia bacterium]MCL2269532.1 hypothetical protein [Chitinispirillia bacterium]